MGRSVFLRGLAVIYLIAFASLLPQVSGLIGSQGILPVHNFLTAVHSEYGRSGYAAFPTLAWFSSSDTFLFVMLWSGIVLAVMLLIGILPLPATIGLYVLYLSIDIVGQDFYSFQWDALLLEVGFAAILLAPWGFRPKYSRPPSHIAVWVFRFLIFRLMLESGAVKLLSGDPAWHNLTALNYHYETQPLPTPLAWYAYHLPEMLQKLSVVGVFAVELILPFFFFATRRLRIIAASITILFQLMIALTGNYTFFNLLTILLCLFLFEGRKPERTPWFPAAVGVLLIVIGVLQLVMMFGLPSLLPQPFPWLDGHAEAFRVVNHYGLFAVMTTSRSEIIIEGSDDSTEWKPYEFKYKPGPVDRPLPWVAPYQPRLDWQMWFAALSSYQQNPWFQELMLRLLEGSPAVTSLLESNPFPDKPPRFIRGVLYDYHFSDAATRRNTGAIWTRSYTGEYFPAVSLKRPE
jgi:lipase maturation factor 1